MTLTEAIAHEEWAATTAHGELAVEHAQMRDWLRELEQLRTENSRLRSELESVGTAAYLYGRGDLKAENAKLRERVAELEELLPDSGRWYRAETVEAYVAEIAKLRELVADMRECALVDGCYACEYGFDGACGKRIAERQRELGAKVVSV